MRDIFLVRLAHIHNKGVVFGDNKIFDENGLFDYNGVFDEIWVS